MIHGSGHWCLGGGNLSVPQFLLDYDSDGCDVILKLFSVSSLCIPMFDFYHDLFFSKFATSNLVRMINHLNKYINLLLLSLATS